MEPIDLTLALEIAGGIGERLETLEKIAKARGQVLLERRAIAPYHLALLGIKAGKAQAVTQAARLCSTILIRWHILPHACPQPMPGHIARREIKPPDTNTDACGPDAG
jgi:hypothetical protein